MHEDIANLPGHQVLALAGKKILRPGGLNATRRLFEWGQFQKGESLLELASSFGVNLMTLARDYGLKVTGIDKNEKSVAYAKQRLDLVEDININILLGDILDLDKLDGEFNYILAEAILTMQTNKNKSRVLSDIHRKLKSGGLILLHELSFTQNADEMHKKLSQVLKVNANALTKNDWEKIVKNAGFEVLELKTGPMTLLTPVGLIKDEGFWGVVKILANIIRQPELRKRIFAMYKFFSTHRDQLEHITICAVKKN